MAGAPLIFDGEKAWKNVLGLSSSRWSSERRSKHWPATAACRLEKAVVLPEIRPGFRVEKEDPIFTIGSCFARNIENHLGALDFRMEAWNFEIPGFDLRPPHSGVILNKFTTHSMTNEVRWALDPEARFPEESIVEESEGLFVDHQVVGEVAAAPREVVLDRRRRIIDIFRRIRNARLVIMTLGLVEAWFDEEAGIYLNRAPGYHTVRKHKGRFSLHLLDSRSNLAALEEIHSLLGRFGRPDVRILVTVSPVPMFETFSGRDVLVANAYSKSTLRCVAEEFAKSKENVEYFPSYESVVLSDRRVAFQEDLHHVSSEIVDVIVRRFVDNYVGGGEVEERAKQAEELAREKLAAFSTDLLGENARLRAEVAALRGRTAAGTEEETLEAARAQGELAGEAARLRGEAAALRLRLATPASTGNDDAAARFYRVVGEGALATVDGHPLPVGTRLEGAAEVGRLTPEGLTVSGWALDRDDPATPVEILVVVDGAVAGRGRGSVIRGDVGQAYSVPDPVVGFAVELPVPEGKDPAVRLFAASLGGFVRELGYHSELFELKHS